MILVLLPKPLELLVEKTVSTSERQMGVGESLRRVFECIASGTLLEGAALGCQTATLVHMSSLASKVTPPVFSPLKMAPESRIHVRRKMSIAFQC